MKRSYPWLSTLLAPPIAPIKMMRMGVSTPRPSKNGFRNASLTLTMVANLRNFVAEIGSATEKYQIDRMQLR